MADLRNDPDRTFSEDTFNELTRLYGEATGSDIAVISLPCVLNDGAGAAEEIAAGAEAVSERVARTARADVVIWGTAASRREELHLRLTHDDGTERGAHAFDDLTFDEILPEDLAALIAAKVTALVQWTEEEAGGWMVPLMQAIEPVTRRLTTNPPPGLNGEPKADVFSAHGQVSYWIGLQTGRNLDLMEAISAFRIALENRDRDQAPLDWAMTQMNLGNALLILGEREPGTARLEEAVTAYRAALQEWNRDRVPLDWANTLGNQGSALLILAERTEDLDRARLALDQLTNAEAVLREGGHVTWAATKARQIPKAQALVDRLSAGP